MFNGPLLSAFRRHEMTNGKSSIFGPFFGPHGTILVGVILLVLALSCAARGAESDAQEGATSLLKTAEEALAEYRFSEAVRLYSLAAQAKSPSSEVFVGRGTAYEMLRRPLKAMEDYRKALELDPQNYRAMENLAGIYERGGKKVREAIDLYRRASRLDPRPEWKENLAVWTAMLETRREEYGATAVTLWHEGNEYLAQGDLDSAEAFFTEALKRNPNMFQAFFSRGLARRGKGDLAAAIGDFGSCLEISPAFPGGLVARALAHEAIGRREQALEDLQRAAEVDWTNAEAHFHLGRLQEERKDYDLAMESYLTALKQKPKPELRTLITRRLAAVRPKARTTQRRKPKPPVTRQQLW